jgi:hypothetical protein
LASSPWPALEEQHIAAELPDLVQGVAHSTAVSAFQGSRDAAVKKRSEAQADSEERALIFIVHSLHNTNRMSALCRSGLDGTPETLSAFSAMVGAEYR